MRFAISNFPLLLIGLTCYSLATFAQTQDPLITSMRKADEARVAMGSVPPWMGVSQSGEPTGYTVELASLALKNMGAPALTPVLTAWEAMIPGLLARHFDLIGPGLVITEPRCRVVVFSAPMIAMHDALFVRSGNPSNLENLRQVTETPEIRLAVVTGSSQEAYVLKQGIAFERLVRVPDIEAGVAVVIGRRANAFVVGQFSISKPEQKGLEVVVDKSTPLSGIGAAFRKEDIRFRDAFDKQLDLLRTNGAWKNLIVKYEVPNWDMLTKLKRASHVVPSCE
ncbi:transporter substrate-binding domain-containing protein [Bradyrhizobium sp. DASA03076]|uniref:transporter substrate-binding domain-containing protein n=1 Tax=Bradyrhizobium sp. BLXBL-03 TaxID=3395916 RepID=UPI003F714611